ncbi:acyl-CoA dehydrogenase family protein, partial [Pseudomonas aeruginosa]
WLSGEVTEQVLDEAALACAAYLVGLMDGAFERTLEYLKVRRQFGREIGSFQALQHRMVDLRIQIELSRAMVEQASAASSRTCSVTSPDNHRAGASRKRRRAR